MGKLTEKEIEKRLKKRVESMGGICYKFNSPGRKHVPDRICVLPMGVTFFVECKAEGKDLRPGQYRELARLARLNHNAYYVNSLHQLHALFLKMQKEIDDADI